MIKMVYYYIQYYITRCSDLPDAFGSTLLRLANKGIQVDNPPY